MNSNQTKSTFESAEIEKTIASIRKILYTVPFNTEEARAKIDEVNIKHPENIGIYNLILYSQNGTGIPICSASSIELRSDLEWKWYYLDAKRAGKTVDEMRKELNKIKQETNKTKVNSQM